MAMEKINCASDGVTPVDISYKKLDQSTGTITVAENKALHDNWLTYETWRLVLQCNIFNP